MFPCKSCKVGVVPGKLGWFLLVVEGSDLDTVRRFVEGNRKKMKPDRNSGSKKESTCDSLSIARGGKRYRMRASENFTSKAIKGDL